MTGFKTVFSGICAVTLLAACQKPMVFTPETIQPSPLQQSTAPVAAPVAVQPVSIQPAPAVAQPVYVLESAPIVETAPEPVYVIESEVAGDAMVQPVVETVVVSEPAYVLEAETITSTIPEPVVQPELEILSAPVLETTAAPVIEQTIVETVAAPVALPAAEVEIVQESFSTFSEGGASGVAIIESSVGAADVMSAPAPTTIIDAQPLAPLGSVVQPGVAAYGEPL